MSRRNVWLSYEQWQIINQELSHINYHPFQLKKHHLKEWEDLINEYPHSDNSHCFERVSIYSIIKELKNDYIKNVLYREYYRSQDMMDVMSFDDTFAGFILNHVDDVDMNTTSKEWESIRIEVKERMGNSDKKTWFCDDIVELYRECVPIRSLSQPNGTGSKIMYS